MKQDKTRNLLISALVLVLSRDFEYLSYFLLSQLFFRQEKHTRCSLSLSLFCATRKTFNFQSFCAFVSITKDDLSHIIYQDRASLVSLTLSTDVQIEYFQYKKVYIKNNNGISIPDRYFYFTLLFKYHNLLDRHPLSLPTAFS